MSAAREALTRVAEERAIPSENLLTPDYLRRLCWDPPQPETAASISAFLLDKGARPWQISLVAEALEQAFVDAHQSAVPQAGVTS
jgi:ribonuclease D